MSLLNRVRYLLLSLVIALAAGLLVLGLIALVTRGPAGASTGFPFVWSAPVTPCPAPNPFNGCGFAYNVPIILLDYAIWVAVIFTLLSVSAAGRGTSARP